MESNEQMWNITLTCPTGTYISDMKNFGFAYKKDRRINAPSHGYSLCHAAMYPLADPFNAGEPRYEEAILDAKANSRRILRGCEDS